MLSQRSFTASNAAKQSEAEHRTQQSGVRPTLQKALAQRFSSRRGVPPLGPETFMLCLYPSVLPSVCFFFSLHWTLGFSLHWTLGQWSVLERQSKRGEEGGQKYIYLNFPFFHRDVAVTTIIRPGVATRLVLCSKTCFF